VTHDNDIWFKCDICYKCDTHKQCHTVTQCDTNPKKFKSEKNTKICLLRNEIDLTHCDIMWHFDMFVTLKVFKLIGPSNDGRRHGRGTYLFVLEHIAHVSCATCFQLVFNQINKQGVAWIAKMNVGANSSSSSLSHSVFSQLLCKRMNSIPFFCCNCCNPEQDIYAPEGNNFCKAILLYDWCPTSKLNLKR
jgi:hypothetical protein